MYFLRKGKQSLALKSFLSEMSSYFMIYTLARYNFRATLFVLLLPLLVMRIAMMVGNWGQHAFVDEIAPDSDFRSSITLIDVPVRLPAQSNEEHTTADMVQSNRDCFNDGWHTSHHLNPRRHWRDHPLAFMKAKKQYEDGAALVFHNIDYIMITVNLMLKNYDHLARCLVPIGNQVGMNHEELVAMLRTKTARFTEDVIRKKFPRP